MARQPIQPEEPKPIKEPRPPREKRSGPGWSGLGSLLAVMLSIAALGVSILETNTVRQAAKVEAWPFIAIGDQYNGQGFGYEMENKGVGPARIRWIELAYRGKRVEDIDQLIIDVLGEEDAFSYDRYRASTQARRVVSPREVVNLFSVDWDPASRRLSNALAPALSIRACYCSIYDECWVAERGEEDPEPVPSCEKKPD